MSTVISLAGGALARVEPVSTSQLEEHVMPSRQEIIARAADDSDFRDKLTSDPKGTLEEELGTTLPDDVIISVLEETAHQVYLVLPAGRSKELRSSELALVAGGADESVLASMLGFQPFETVILPPPR